MAAKDRAVVDDAAEWRRATRITPTGDLPPVVCDHTCVLYEATRTVLLFGGHVSAIGVSASLYEYDVDGKAWSCAKVGPTVPPPRCNHTSVMFGSRMVVFGGFGGPDRGWLDDLWVYSADTKAWRSVEQKGDRPSARQGHAAAKVGDRKMIVFGGFDGQTRLADVFQLDVDTWQWEQLKCTGLAPSRRDGATIAAIGPAVYLFGGYTVSKSNEVFVLRLDTRAWSKLPAVPGLPAGRFSHSCEVIHDKMYILHGFDAVQYSSVVWEYDPAGHKWRKVDFTGDVIEPRCQNSSTLVMPDQKVIVFGGWDGCQYLNSLFEYEFAEPSDLVKPKKK
eukprot:GGOE01061453.1.p1 GENE.GGOE01061453.1~~GGOE01061453.1.p1  ORF type:complete len:333 (+),score=71.24 GGOE01061453.1:85-1083(+)